MRRTMIIGALLAGGLALAGCAPSTEAPSPNPPAPGTPPPPSAIAPAGPENSQGQGQGEGQGPGQGQGGAEGQGEGPSGTDQQFARMMVPHHEQALELAELAASNSQNPQVRDLANRIAQAQGPEIAQMQAWLAQQGGQSAGAPGENPQQGGMSGMVSPQAMDALRQASGEEFDRLWVEAMIQHHEGAVEMAQSQLEEGSDQQMRGLAEQIVGTQQAELQELRSLQG